MSLARDEPAATAKASKSEAPQYRTVPNTNHSYESANEREHTMITEEHTITTKPTPKERFEH